MPSKKLPMASSATKLDASRTVSEASFMASAAADMEAAASLTIVAAAPAPINMQKLISI